MPAQVAVPGKIQICLLITLGQTLFHQEFFQLDLSLRLPFGQCSGKLLRGLKGAASVQGGSFHNRARCHPSFQVRLILSENEAKSISPTQVASGNQAHDRRINRSLLDFVLCLPSGVEMVVCILEGVAEPPRL